MTTVLLAGLAWTTLALPVALLLGRAIRLGDEAAEAPFGTDSVERYLREQASAQSS
ncbi:hypothetical protein [Blastococcus sp. SYSU DS0617]